MTKEQFFAKNQKIHFLKKFIFFHFFEYKFIPKNSYREWYGSFDEQRLFSVNSHVSATFSILLRFEESWNCDLLLVEAKSAAQVPATPGPLS